MNIILLEDGDFTSDKNTVCLNDARFEHIRDILKSEVGDTLKIGLLNGKLGIGILEKISPKSLSLQVKLNQFPPQISPITLILALPRPIVLKRLLMHITTLGVKEIHLIQTARVEKSYWQSPVLKSDSIESILKEGLTQAKDTVMPEVFFHKRFKPFIDDELPKIAKNKLCFVAHPGSGEKIKATAKACVLAVGPEGGFTDYEIEKLQCQNFSAIDVGVRILKVETAVVVCIAQLSL